MAINSVTILGSSSGRNAGDAALLSGIMDSVDAACDKRLVYEIPTYRPDFVHASYRNRVRGVSMLPWDGTVGMLGLPTYNSVKRTDLTIIYDAMLFDRKLWNPLTNYMPAARLFLPMAKKKGSLTGLFNCGTGPVQTAAGCKMLKEIGDTADFLTLRDNEGLDLLRDIGVKNPNALVTADAALNVPPSSKNRIDGIMKELGLAGASEILAVNVNTYLNTWTESGDKPLTQEEFTTVMAAALDLVRKELNVPLLFVCTQHHDVEITTQVMSKLKERGQTALFSNKIYSHYDIRGVFEKVSMLFAMRLHANILCSAAKTPISGLMFQKKVTNYYKLLGLEERLLSFSNFEKQKLAEHILKCWQERAQAKAQLEVVIPKLQREALRAADLIALLDRGIKVEDAVNQIRQEQQVNTAQLLASNQ
jgi:polysaccharide pyruvyl transferase WcaK-like protein